jgi:hypothetical protein
MDFEEPGLKFALRADPDMLIPEILMQIRWNQPELADFKRLWNCICEVRGNLALKAKPGFGEGKRIKQETRQTFICRILG